MTLTYIPSRSATQRKVNAPERESILAFHRSLPGYEETPLFDCPSIAQLLGVRQVLVKDESKRLGLPSFKMLGASWATASSISRNWLSTSTAPKSIAWLISELETKFGANWREGRRLVAATDGNHGRGVARMAKLLGLRCQIFVPAGTAISRIRGIESEGARVDVVEGSYDDAIARSAQEASQNSLVISDTSWEGYTDTPTNVIQGYSTMFAEIDNRMQNAIPSAVVLQSGVGAFAAAGIAHWASKGQQQSPKFIIVEPLAANCLLRSAQSNSITLAPGPHDSSMAGLNCGLPSLIAWPLIEHYASGFIAIDDEFTFEAMRILARCGIVAGESGAAGLAGLLAVKDSPARDDFGLGESDTVLLINTEWATDPVNFRRVVGNSAWGVMLTRRRRQRKSKTVNLAAR